MITLVEMYLLQISVVNAQKLHPKTKEFLLRVCFQFHALNNS